MISEEERLRLEGELLYEQGTGSSRQIPFSYNGVSFVRDVFIETGTDSGLTTVHARRSGFKECHTIDVDPPTAQRAKQLFSGVPGVFAHRGDSRKLLPLIIDPKKNTTFFLDAHSVVERQYDSPLREELAIIASVDWNRPPLVMIDDGGYDMTPGEVRDALPGYDVRLWRGGSHGEDTILFCALEGGHIPVARKNTHQPPSVRDGMEQRIDFCVALSGSDESVAALWSLFWRTLKDKCDLTGVKFHLVNKNVGKSVVERAAEMASAEVHDLPFVWARYDGAGTRSTTSDDVAFTYNYMVTKCGTERWVCLSHFDLYFKKDWLTEARSLARDLVGMVGHHCPIMLLDREAYKKSKVQFSVVPGLNTGQGLERELCELGYQTESFEDFNHESENNNGHHEWFHHIGGGGTHYGKAEVDVKVELVRTALDRLDGVMVGPSGVERAIIGGLMEMQAGQTVIHLLSREKYSIRKDQTMMRDSWQEVPWFVACMAYVTDFRANQPSQVIARSNDPRAVNCPACKATHEFRRAMEQLPR